MSSSKEYKKIEIPKSWHANYGIVYAHFCSLADSKGFKANVRSFCDFLEISAGKRQKWSLGQWPSAEDLEKLHDKFGFSYRWLIKGEGDPFGEEEPRQAGGLKAEAEKGEVVSEAVTAELAALREKLAVAQEANARLAETNGRLSEELIRMNAERRKLEERLDWEKMPDKTVLLPPAARGGLLDKG